MGEKIIPNERGEKDRYPHIIPAILCRRSIREGEDPIWIDKNGIGYVMDSQPDAGSALLRLSEDWDPREDDKPEIIERLPDNYRFVKGITLTILPYQSSREAVLCVLEQEKDIYGTPFSAKKIAYTFFRDTFEETASGAMIFQGALFAQGEEAAVLPLPQQSPRSLPVLMP